MVTMVLQVHSFGEPSGRPVVALHGTGGHGRRFRRLAEAYLTGIHIYAPDLRGHGRSDWSPPWTIEQHVEDVLATMDSLGLEQTDLIGHSYGGAIAIHLAARSPERVGSLALLDPAIGLPALAAADGAHEAMTSPAFVDPVNGRIELTTRWPLAPAEVLDEEVADHLQRGPDDLWRWRYDPAAVVTAYSEMARPAVLPPTGIPVLLVPALRADFVQPEYLARCRAALGDGLVITGIDCSHMLYIDRPAETAALIMGFLDRVRSRSR